MKKTSGRADLHAKKIHPFLLGASKNVSCVEWTVYISTPRFPGSCQAMMSPRAYMQKTCR